MMKSDYLTDITLVTDDRVHLKAHKIVLSACSVVFKSIINEIPENSVIYLGGIQYQEMKSILEFMYLGLATFDRNRIDEFMKVAKNLEIKVISENFEFDTSQDNLESTNIDQRQNEGSIETERKEDILKPQEKEENLELDRKESTKGTERKEDSFETEWIEEEFKIVKYKLPKC